MSEEPRVFKAPFEDGEFGPSFHVAGRCSMYLRWLESRLMDFLCIKDAKERNDSAILREYNEMQQKRCPRPVYQDQVFKWSRPNLGVVVEEFLNEWPEYRAHTVVSNAFTMAELYRNAFAHAYMGTSGWLVFNPMNNKTKKLISALGGDPDKPLVLPCFNEVFVVRFYDQVIKTIDFACFMQVANQLGVEYASTLADPNWPVTEGINPVTLETEGKAQDQEEN